MDGHDEFPEFPVRMIGIRSLRDENFVQGRTETNMGHARGITKFCLVHGFINEPIVVFDDGHVLRVADGIHRVIGYREAARVNKAFLQIRAEIRPGGLMEATLYAAGANKEIFRLKRSKADIDHQAVMIFTHPDGKHWDAKRVAQHLGITEQTAARKRNTYFRSQLKTVPPTYPNDMAPEEIKEIILEKRKNPDAFPGFVVEKGKLLVAEKSPSKEATLEYEKYHFFYNDIVKFFDLFGIHCQVLSKSAFFYDEKILCEWGVDPIFIEFRGCSRIIWAVPFGGGSTPWSIGAKACMKAVLGDGIELFFIHVREYTSRELGILDLPSAILPEYMHIDNFIAYVQAEGDPTPAPEQP